LINNGSFEDTTCDTCGTFYEFEQGCVTDWQNYHSVSSVFDSTDPNCTFFNGVYYYAPHQDQHALIDVNSGIFQAGDFQPGTYTISFRYTRGEALFTNYPVYVNVGFADGLNNVTWNDTSNLSIPIENVVSHLVDEDDPVAWATYTGTFTLTQAYQNIVIYGSSQMKSAAVGRAPTMRALIDNFVLECQDCCKPDDIIITADGQDITDTLTYTIPCGETCMTLNATNVQNAVYNTTDPVLTNLQGLFCVIDPTMTSFTATITGQDSCGDPITKQIQVNIEQDCCDDEISIVPFWAHPECPEVVCEAEKWPIHVTDANGNPITSAGGVQIQWTNQNTGAVLNQDFVFAQEGETWTVVVTYPNGCEYTATYFEDCCDDDVFIEAIVCPTQADLLAYENQLAEKRNTLSTEEYQKRVDALNQMKKAESGDCDPCDIGWVLIKLVDANGNDINPANYTSIVWSDGGSGTMRMIPVNTTITVTVTQVDGERECVYTDTFNYPCDDKCDGLTAPTNLQVVGTTLTWDPVPGATSYIVTSPAGNEPQIFCDCRYQVSIVPLTTNTNSVVLPAGLEDACFVWRVQAVCPDGTTSPHSSQMCYGTGVIKDPVIKSVTLSPNPSSGNVNISLTSAKGGRAVVEIHSLYGTVVDRMTVDITAHEAKSIFWNKKGVLSKGIYLVTIRIGDETVRKKLIVE
jgi:hypothetical protein